MERFEVETMQEALDQCRNELWKQLKPHFDKYANEKGEVKNENIEQVLRDIFANSSVQDIDYAAKNIHRLDLDGNGSVDFPEFANFLFKMHAGEMSLQRRHLKGHMQKGDQRKMTYQEFEILINDAVSFLNVKIPSEVCLEIFKKTVKNHKDEYMTYVEYFQAVAIYICKSRAVLEKQYNSPVKLRAEKPLVRSEPIHKDPKRSLIREFFWENLRKLYFHYCLGRQIPHSELRALVISIFGDLNELELTYIISGLHDLEGQYIEFIPFAMRFLYLIAEVGLARWSRYHPSGLRTLTLDQWLVLFKNTYKFLSIYQISNKFLELLYRSISDGKNSITFGDYLDWVRDFLACEHWYGERYAFIEDDPNRDNCYSLFYTQLEIPTVITRPTRVGKYEVIKFNFSDTSFAYKVRERMMKLLVEFDKDKDEQFSEEEIREALTIMLNEDENELDYVTRNVFRYDRDGDRIVTYDELTNFAVEQHFGELAIQRLHRKKFYGKWKERIMNKEEFGKTLNYALKHIQMEAEQKLIDILFDEIDLDHDGWISYEVYFYFLKYYFGSLSVASRKPHFEPKKPLSFRDRMMKLMDGLSHYDRVVKLLYEQLRFIFLQYDENKNLVFEPNEIEAILVSVFTFSQREIQHIMLEIFRIDSRNQVNINFEDLCAIILDIFFVNIWLMRKYDDYGRHGWKNRKIDIQEFIMLITEGCFFVTIKPFEEDLKSIFKDLDTDHDGYITLNEYIDFIRKYLGRDLSIEDLPTSPKKKVASKPINFPEETKEVEIKFVDDIWGELKRLFDQYDKNKKGYLIESEFKSFAVEVLNERSQNELKYIFWNMFRLDEDLDMKIEFEEFAPYVLKHAGEIALQRFHLNQTRGKGNLSEEELYIVISQAYSFLQTMPKSRPVVSDIFNRLKKDGHVSYGAYLHWTSTAVARKFR